MKQQNTEIADVEARIRSAEEGLDLLGTDCRIFPPPVMARGTNLSKSCNGETPCYRAASRAEAMGYSQEIVFGRIMSRTYE